MNRHFERIWKEVIMDYFKVLSWHFPGGTEENHEQFANLATSWLRFEPRTSQIRNCIANCLAAMLSGFSNKLY